MKGEIITALYSFGCPELRQFGAENFIFGFLKDPTLPKLPQARTILERLEPYLFYQLIAKKNNLEPFDPRVVRAHWLGNELLKEIEERDIKECFSKISTHDTRILKLIDLTGGLPHHNFDALWILKKVKKITADLQKEINDCMIRVGKVIEIKNDKILVETQGIVFDEFHLENTKEEISKFFLKEIKIGDYVSIHFGKARERITASIAKNLTRISQEALSFFRG